MSDDIVTRLRNPTDLTVVMWEAADEIERLREQNEYLKANIEMLLAEARQSKYGMEDMYER